MIFGTLWEIFKAAVAASKIWRAGHAPAPRYPHKPASQRTNTTAHQPPRVLNAAAKPGVAAEGGLAVCGERRHWRAALDDHGDGVGRGGRGCGCGPVAQPDPGDGAGE